MFLVACELPSSGSCQGGGEDSSPCCVGVVGPDGELARTRVDIVFSFGPDFTFEAGVVFGPIALLERIDDEGSLDPSDGARYQEYYGVPHATLSPDGTEVLFYVPVYFEGASPPPTVGKPYAIVLLRAGLADLRTLVQQRQGGQISDEELQQSLRTLFGVPNAAILQDWDGEREVQIRGSYASEGGELSGVREFDPCVVACGGRMLMFSAGLVDGEEAGPEPPPRYLLVAASSTTDFTVFQRQGVALDRRDFVEVLDGTYGTGDSGLGAFATFNDPDVVVFQEGGTPRFRVQWRSVHLGGAALAVGAAPPGEGSGCCDLTHDPDDVEEGSGWAKVDELVLPPYTTARPPFLQGGISDAFSEVDLPPSRLEYQERDLFGVHVPVSYRVPNKVGPTVHGAWVHLSEERLAEDSAMVRIRWW